jgi:capsular exopolysaccharide synthesis family protein
MLKPATAVMHQAGMRRFSQGFTTMRTGWISPPAWTVVMIMSSMAVSWLRPNTTVNSTGLATASAGAESNVAELGKRYGPEHPKMIAAESELVAGNATLQECVVHQQDEKIDVLSAGLIPPNPLELLSSRKFNNTLKVLREQYDRIIIDCAPTLPVSDARVLSTLIDSVVYVVKADATSVNKVKSGLDHLSHVNAPITGIVLNQLDVRKARKYSDYGYGNYYGTYESLGNS